mmetsp:Transcript_24678/g.93327  ORF Transcript_24678/g.93327 Transcript_24678/m.93327 type:complete len:371 (-) Transcript_24678:2284-3396(-)
MHSCLVRNCVKSITGRPTVFIPGPRLSLGGRHTPGARQASLERSLGSEHLPAAKHAALLLKRGSVQPANLTRLAPGVQVCSAENRHGWPLIDTERSQAAGSSRRTSSQLHSPTDSHSLRVSNAGLLQVPATTTPLDVTSPWPPLLNRGSALKPTTPSCRAEPVSATAACSASLAEPHDGSVGSSDPTHRTTTTPDDADAESTVSRCAGTPVAPSTSEATEASNAGRAPSASGNGTGVSAMDRGSSRSAISTGASRRIVPGTPGCLPSGPRRRTSGERVEPRSGVTRTSMSKPPAVSGDHATGAAASTLRSGAERSSEGGADPRDVAPAPPSVPADLAAGEASSAPWPAWRGATRAWRPTATDTLLSGKDR